MVSGLLIKEYDGKDPEKAVEILAANTRSKGLPGQNATILLAFLMCKSLKWAVINLEIAGVKLPVLADGMLDAISKWIAHESSWQELDHLQRQVFAEWKTLDMLKDSGQMLAKQDTKVELAVWNLFWLAGLACVECDPTYQKNEVKKQMFIFSKAEIRNSGTDRMKRIISSYLAQALAELLGGEKDAWQKRIYDEVIFVPG